MGADILPRHVICVLGRWESLAAVKSVVDDFGGGFELDEDYSQVERDDRMGEAFEASVDRFQPTMREEDWESVSAHTAVAYVLSPPMEQAAAEHVSGQALILTAKLLEQGGIAVKSESAGLAHGRSEWIQLSRRYGTAINEGDTHTASAMLYRAWVFRLIHDPASSSYYSLGMHLLGHRDTEIDDSMDVGSALAWLDLMGLYLVADKPVRPICDGAGFRLTNPGPRRIVKQRLCDRYESDDFFFNPYGYNRLVADSE